ncbi:MAG: ankyrin repeat domain-containing protein, partial [Nitrospinaceae bacterium]
MKAPAYAGPGLRVLLIGALCLTPWIAGAAEPSLREAVLAGNLSQVRQAIAAGDPVNTDDLEGMTPLHYAAQKGFGEIAGVLIKNGANVNERSLFGATPLHLAAFAGHLKTIKVLLGQGADNTARTEFGQSPLLWAATGGRRHVMDYLMEKGAGAEPGAELLFFTVVCDLARVRHWVERGAAVNTPGKDGTTAVFLAARNGDLELTSFLVNQGANLKVRVQNGMTPLHFAASMEVARFLMERGLPPTDHTPLGVYPLHTAAENGHAGVVEGFIAQGAPVDFPTLLRRTPLHLAALAGNKQVVATLLRLGADPRRRDIRRRTPLDLARRQGHGEVVTLLETATQPGPPADLRRGK